MIEKSIYSILSNDAGIVALVSAKIYPMVLPQNFVMPAIVYRNNGIEKSSNYDTAVEQFTQTTIQIDSIADSYSEMKDVSQAIFNAVNNTRGVTLGNMIYSIEQESYLELYDDGLEAYRASRIFLISHYEA